ncbi:MAG: hypothetical protein ACJAZJ_001372 [Candidatus Endobugula sp.]|jgi:hypothetical protein
MTKEGGGILLVIFESENNGNACKKHTQNKAYYTPNPCKHKTRPEKSNANYYLIINGQLSADTFVNSVTHFFTWLKMRHILTC